MYICTGNSGFGWCEEMICRPSGCRVKDRGIWSHTDWVGIPFCSLVCVTLRSDLDSEAEFSPLQKKIVYGAAGLELFDPISPTSLDQDLV